jgi:hypothetical protein
MVTPGSEPSSVPPTLAPAEVAQATCPLCAEALAEDASRCPSCGGRLGEALPSDMDGPAQRRPARVSAVALLNVGVAVAGLGLLGVGLAQSGGLPSYAGSWATLAVTLGVLLLLLTTAGGLWAMQPWARWIGLVVGVLGLASVTLTAAGTLVAVLVLFPSERLSHPVGIPVAGAVLWGLLALQLALLRRPLAD